MYCSTFYCIVLIYFVGVQFTEAEDLTACTKADDCKVVKES
uniref:Venom peptide n=1 Tax=Strongyloides papillosus TaxID=174720 RepID=A0A0N5BBB9_STREA